MAKYADQPTTEATADIDAPPGRVWPLLIDINLPGRFSTEFQRAEWIDDGPAVGARFIGHNEHEVIGSWSVECEVSAFEPEQVFEWSPGGTGDGRFARWRFDLEPRSDSGSTLTFTAQMGPGPSGLTPAIEAMPDKEERIVERRLGEWQANMQRTVDGIKQLAEAGDAPTTP